MFCELRAQTMVEMLATRATDHPDRTAYIFLDDRDGVTEITFGELDRRAQAIAARLQLELQPGDRALLGLSGRPGIHFGVLRLHVRRRRRGAGDVSEAEAADAAAAADRARLRCPRRAVDRPNAHDARSRICCRPTPPPASGSRPTN